MLANPARGGLNVPVRARELGLTRQFRYYTRLVSTRSFFTPRLNLVLTRRFLFFLPLSTTAPIYTASTAVRSVPPECIGSCNSSPKWSKYVYMYVVCTVCIYVCSMYVYMYVFMYVYMVITNSRVWINRVRLPSLLVICRRSNLIIWSLETRSAVSSRVSLLVLHTQAKCGAYLRYFFCFPRRRPFIYTINRHRVSPSLSRHSIAYRQRSLPRGRRRRASSLPGSPSSGCCLLRY